MVIRNAQRSSAMRNGHPHCILVIHTDVAFIRNANWSAAMFRGHPHRKLAILKVWKGRGLLGPLPSTLRLGGSSGGGGCRCNRRWFLRLLVTGRFGRTFNTTRPLPYRQRRPVIAQEVFHHGI